MGVAEVDGDSVLKQLLSSRRRQVIVAELVDPRCKTSAEFEVFLSMP